MDVHLTCVLDPDRAFTYTSVVHFFPCSSTFALTFH